METVEGNLHAPTLRMVAWLARSRALAIEALAEPPPPDPAGTLEFLANDLEAIATEIDERNSGASLNEAAYPTRVSSG